MYGFLLCFASTSTATVMHYVLDMPAPYAWYTLPKILGVIGGVMLSVGALFLMKLKRTANPELGSASRWGGDWVFIWLLFLTASTGLLLWMLGGTLLMPLMLAVHLGCVLTLFLMMPYSKMVHGFFRLAALTRDAQTNGS